MQPALTFLSKGSLKISRKFKEAFKTSLAMVLVFAIALKVGWMNPYWAGWAVGMIALPTAGQSIHKGLMRMMGTIPGCLSALIILSLAAQSRWLFLFLCCVWIFFTTYMMLYDTQRSYFWNVAGFVSLIIAITDPSSSNTVFQHAIFRTLETGMGVVVYTLVSVFIWPQTNSGAIKKSSGELVDTQMQLFHTFKKVLAGQESSEKLSALRNLEVKQLGELNQALAAEGSESYSVQEVRHLLDHFQSLATTMMGVFDRWHMGLTDHSHVKVDKVFVDLHLFSAEIDERFNEIKGILAGKQSGYMPRSVSLAVDTQVVHGLSHLERAALAVSRHELEMLGTVTNKMLLCVRDIYSTSTSIGNPLSLEHVKKSSAGRKLPVFDIDYLLRAAFAAACVAIGFILWVFVNPPGHGAWFNLSGSLGMAVASMPQLRTTMLLKPIGVAAALALAVYVFIMPQLSTFAELGLMLFMCMFIVCYFFTGLGQLAGIIGILNEISIQNQQTYNFAAMANGYVFLVAVFAFIFAVSYLMRSARPEKAVLHLMGRFFRCAESLIALLALHHGSPPSLYQQWKKAMYLHEIRTLPTKIGGWSKAINHTLFLNTTPQQLSDLLASLQSLVYRIEELVEAGEGPQAQSLLRGLHKDMRDWSNDIGPLLKSCSSNVEIESAAELKERLRLWFVELEGRIENILQNEDVTMVSDEEGANFYRLLGGIRGVSLATVSYAELARTIDWAELREERFS